ncbi:hypothetical protein IFM89_006460 [Coptis chinensis]|uniref:Uncharacterized protein n=1 Tax=Coptis chinensis TaxID=261450 RepID=A0A835IPE3_9MAGN|nr:hypothetical protein IFM89_006460 [Coptis chinensis]
MNTNGLLAILDGCQNLECLELRDCVNLNLYGGLLKKRLCRIKDFKYHKEVVTVIIGDYVTNVSKYTLTYDAADKIPNWCIEADD